MCRLCARGFHLYKDIETVIDVLMISALISSPHVNWSGYMRHPLVRSLNWLLTYDVIYTIFQWLKPIGSCIG